MCVFLCVFFFYSSTEDSMRSASFALFPLAFHPGHRHTLIFPNRQFSRRDTTYVKINVFFPASPQLVKVPSLKLGAGQTHFILTFTYPLTVEVVWSPQMTTQPVSSIFPVLHCPLGLGELQACQFPFVVFPPHPLSALSSSPFQCALQDGFGQT